MCTLAGFEVKIIFFYFETALADYTAVVVNSEGLVPGPNPTTSIYNTSVVKIYNATNSLAHF
jgi:hypothetical protein